MNVIVPCLLVFCVAGSALAGGDSIRFPPINTLKDQNSGHFTPALVHKHFREGIDAVRRVADSILKVIDNPAVRESPRNWVISSLSWTAVTAQILLGSRGHLQTILSDFLCLEKGVRPTAKLEVHRQMGQLMNFIQRYTNQSYTLELNSAVFIQPEIQLKTSYKHALLDLYNVQIHPLDFMREPLESTKIINDWVRYSTHGKLPTLFTDPLPVSTSTIMANAVYFNGRWEMPFFPDYTSPGPFYISPTEKVTVDFMFGEKELLYKNTSSLQLIGIPYKNWEVVFYVILPHGKLHTSLDIRQLDDLISTARVENITLLMPKLKLLSTVSVKKSVLNYLLQPTAMRSGSSTQSPEEAAASQSDGSIFDDAERFDVGGASDDARFKINDFIHQVFMEVDEKGSELAAVTAGLIDYIADNFVVRIDRPFWFFIRHELTSTHLFWGRIVNPTVQQN